MSQIKTKLWLGLNNCHYLSYNMPRKLNSAMIFMNNKLGIYIPKQFGVIQSQ